jgi:hypothetical protein
VLVAQRTLRLRYRTPRHLGQITANYSRKMLSGSVTSIASPVTAA